MIVVNDSEPDEIYEVLSRYIYVERYSINVGYLVQVGDITVECNRILIDDYIQKLSEEVEDEVIQSFSESSNFSILFIIGYFSPMIMDIVVRRETYISSLVKMIGRKIVPVILETDYDMILFLKNLHLFLEKEEKIAEINELMEIRGIGFARAKLLLKRFGTVENVKKASLHELIDCGIDLGTAKEIRKNRKEG